MLPYGITLILGDVIIEFPNVLASVKACFHSNSWAFSFQFLGVFICAYIYLPGDEKRGGIGRVTSGIYHSVLSSASFAPSIVPPIALSIAPWIEFSTYSRENTFALSLLILFDY
jgi:hypothetical protein